MIGVTNYSKLGEDLGGKEDASLAVFLWLIGDITEGTMLGTIEGLI